MQEVEEIGSVCKWLQVGEIVSGTSIFTLDSKLNSRITYPYKALVIFISIYFKMTG